jgi:hypothetical protein
MNTRARVLATKGDPDGRNERKEGKTKEKRKEIKKERENESKNIVE